MHPSCYLCRAFCCILALHEVGVPIKQWIHPSAFRGYAQPVIHIVVEYQRREVAGICKHTVCATEGGAREVRSRGGSYKTLIDRLLEPAASDR